MKKLFTLIALLACFMGAKAEWVTDYTIDYSTNTGFPFYVMGYVPEWINGVMTDYGADYRYATQADLDGDGDAKWKDGETSVGATTTQGGTEYQKVTGAGPYWHQYFVADGIPTEIDGTYKVVAMVKASEPVNVPIQMRWSWGADPATGTLAVGTEWAEVEVTFSGIGGNSCSLIAQPGTSTATIEWKSITVSHNQKAQRPTTWQEWLNSDGQPFIMSEGAVNEKYMGDAETPWSDPNVAYNDADKNYLICAWSKEKGHNMDENGEAWNPFPANIEVDPTDANNHVFVVHGQPATTEGDPSAWDNQFWIESPKQWKAGDQIKVRFRYRANMDGVKTNTQIHHQTPSDYQHWNAVGDVTFTTEWQTFEKTFSWPGDGARDNDTGWSIAFNLNPEVKDAVDFYFDDLSWQTMKLDEGYFVAGANTIDGIEYDLDNAIPFEYDDEEGIYTATVGETGAYVNQIMISTVRGNDAAFKSNTLKPDYVVDDPEDWASYTESGLAKLNLPGVGIWKIYLDPTYLAMAFEMLEGEAIEMKDIVTNPTEVVVHGQERDDMADTQNQDGSITINEEEGGTGQAWDNQFFIIANRELEKGEVTVIEFDYLSSVEATSGTQCHGDPGAYLHWNCIGSLNFTPAEQHFTKEFTVPSEADKMKSIAFNMAEIRGACDYTVKNVKWYIKDASNAEGKTPENLINATGTKNFYVKEGAGTAPYEYGTSTGIENVVDGNNVKSNGALYNIAGQRVNKDYKGIVIQDGKKFINK